MNKIAIVCVNYESYDYTIKMCKSLKWQKGIHDLFELEVFVVDNSKNVSNTLIEYCRNEPMIRYLRSEKNNGYFAGLNEGLSSIDVTKYEYVCIGNNDLEFKDDFFLHLTGLSVKGEVYSLCPDIVTSDGVHQNPHVKTKISLAGKFKLDLYYSNWYVAVFLLKIKSLFDIFFKIKYQKAMSESCEIHMGIGALYILTKSFFLENKELHFPFFLYGEEAFFSNQIHTTGGLLIYEPSLVVNHAESATLSKVPSKIRYLYAKESYSTYRGML
jgi:GT2 family glycosyltransferase